MHSMIKNGPVAFCDILGYKGFIDKNPLEYVAELIASEIVDLPLKLAKSQDRKFKQAFDLNQFDASKIGRSVSITVVSDSVLLAACFEEHASKQEQLTGWLVFSILCRELFDNMFEKGLPLRGAIGYGAFFLRGNCFAGKPIIEAYNLASCLDLSAFVLTPSAFEKWNDLFSIRGSEGTPTEKLLKGCFVRYGVPVKDHDHCCKEMLTLKPRSELFVGKDIRQVVFESFSSHNKTISKRELSKCENTEMFFRFVSSR